MNADNTQMYVPTSAWPNQGLPIKHFSKPVDLKSLVPTAGMYGGLLRPGTNLGRTRQ
jgi:hypothetical protein